MNNKIPKEFQNSFILGQEVILRHPVTYLERLNKKYIVESFFTQGRGMGCGRRVGWWMPPSPFGKGSGAHSQGAGPASEP